MKYNNAYVKESLENYVAQFKKDYECIEYSIDIEGSFADPPIVMLCKFMQDTGDMDMQDVMIRHCILGRMVTVYLDGEVKGSFKLNGLTDAWEVIPVINEHPKAYKLLADIVTGYLAKKFVLPRKKTNATGAVRATAK